MMTSAVFPEQHYISHNDQPHFIPNPSPNFNPNLHYHSTVNGFVNQNPKPYNPPPAFSYSVDLKKEFPHIRSFTFHLDSYSTRELKGLKDHFSSELQRIRRLSLQIKAREQELGSTLHQIESSNVRNKEINGETKNLWGDKRSMPSSGRQVSCRKKVAVSNSIAALQKAEAAMMRKCRQMLGKLMQHKHGWVFNKPVDAVKLGLHNYKEIIKYPMDLGTVKSKLSMRKYHWPLDFASDIRLTFKNALTYNPIGHDVHTMATDLLDMFEKMFNPVYQEFEAEHQRIIAARQNVKEPFTNPGQLQVALPQQDGMNMSMPMISQTQLCNQQAHTFMSPLKVAGEIVTGLQKELLESKAKGPGNGVMSREHQERLGLSLQELAVERMDEILQIVMKRNAALAAADGEGDVELDIEALDNETLWDLDQFVRLQKESSEKKMRKGMLASEPTKELPKKVPLVKPMIQELTAALVKAEEDVDIGDNMALIDYSPLENEKEMTRSGRSCSSSSSSSGCDYSSSSDLATFTECNSEAGLTGKP